MLFNIKSSIVGTIKKGIFLAKNYLLFFKIKNNLKGRELQTIEDLDFFEFRDVSINYIETKRCDLKLHTYKVSDSASVPTLYGPAYACMILGLVGELSNYSEEDRRNWCAYFDSFQSSEDGLFHDPVIKGSPYYDSDWWGARHLALHMISAYSSLGRKPKYRFSFLKKYYGSNGIKNWLDGFDWPGGPKSFENDIDNQIMNVGCLLQYQRDVWEDIEAGLAVDRMKSYLRKKVSSSTGL